LIITNKGGHARRKVGNFSGLLYQFAENYPARLRPKQLLGRFKAGSAEQLASLELGKFGAQWGGALAARRLLGDTEKPHDESLELWLRDPAKLNELVKSFGLTPVSEAEEHETRVEVYQAFWKGSDSPWVDPVLAFSDLIASGQPEQFALADRLISQKLVKG
jgi:hypothetical protein